MSTLHNSMSQARFYGSILDAIIVTRIGSVKAGSPTPALPPHPPAAATDRGVRPHSPKTDSPVIFFDGGR